MAEIKIIAEIGINHNGDAKEALALIEAAHQVGVLGVKFQYRNLDNAYVKDANQIGGQLKQKKLVRIMRDNHNFYEFSRAMKYTNLDLMIGAYAF
jgi:sialic acid synthase SpsE